MLDTIGELQTDFAYSVGENAAPAASTSEYTRRLRHLNQARAEILNSRRDWWFMIDHTPTVTTVADQAEYDIPSTAKSIRSVRVNSSLPYDKLSHENSFRYTNSTYPANLPPNYEFGMKGKWYQIDNKFGLIPVPSDSTSTIHLTTYKTFDELTTSSVETEFLIPETHRHIWVDLATEKWYRSRGRHDLADVKRMAFERAIGGMMDEQRNFEGSGHLLGEDEVA